MVPIPYSVIFASFPAANHRFQVNYRGSHSRFVRCGSHCSRKSCNMHRGWQIRRPATQSSRRKFDARARSSCFVLPYIDPFFLRTTVLLSDPLVPMRNSAMFVNFPAANHHFAGQKRGSEDGFRCFGLFSACEPLFSNDFSWFAFQVRP